MSEASDAAPSGTDAPSIEVEDVSAGYGDVPVLEGVSLAVEDGEFVGLVGPNGAGKTTLLKAINGLVEPRSGTVRVAGQDVHVLSSRAASRLVATVPQETSISFDFPVEDVVAMGRTPYHGRLSGDPDEAAAVERALERTETVSLRERAVTSLSGGEYQRVMVARALAQETPALLLDEPTASLDINYQVGTLELVRGLVDDEGTAALAAIHDLDLAARFCDRIALLADGDLLAVGPPDDVLHSDPLRAAFGTDAAVLPNPVTGTPTVTPISVAADRERRCHVVGTGQTAARVVAALHRSGFAVTAGVVPEGGVTAATAAELGIEAVTAPPFDPLDESVERAVGARADAADVVVAVGDVAPVLRDVVADQPTAVTVDPAGTKGAIVDAVSADASDGTGTDPPTEAPSGSAVESTGGPDRSLVETVRRAARRARGTDD